MSSIPRRFRRLVSGVLSSFATPLVGNVWPLILRRVLSQSEFTEKSLTSVLSGVRDALIIAPHPDDEYFGCPDLLLSASEFGIKMTLSLITDGLKQESGSSMSRLDMSSNVARRNGWAFDVMGLPDGFSEDLAVDITGRLGEFLCPYLQGDDRVDLIIMPIWSDYHSDHRAITLSTLDVLSESPECPNIILYWTFSAPMQIPNCAELVRIDSNRWTGERNRWRLEYSNFSAGSATLIELIRAAVSEACWGQIGYETVLWVSSSHVAQAHAEARESYASCVSLSGSRCIIHNTAAYGIKAALSSVPQRRP